MVVRLGVEVGLGMEVGQRCGMERWARGWTDTVRDAVAARA